MTKRNTVNMPSRGNSDGVPFCRGRDYLVLFQLKIVFKLFNCFWIWGWICHGRKYIILRHRIQWFYRFYKKMIMKISNKSTWNLPGSVFCKLYCNSPHPNGWICNIHNFKLLQRVEYTMQILTHYVVKHTAQSNTLYAVKHTMQSRTHHRVKHTILSRVTDTVENNCILKITDFL